VIPITLGGVDQVDPQFPGTSQELIYFLLRETLAPFAPKLPGSNTNHRYPKTCIAETAVFHEITSWMMRNEYCVMRKR